MKKLILLLAFAFVLLLNACANASIRYSLDDDHTVAVTYAVDFSDAGDDANYYLAEIDTYWKQQSFETTLDPHTGSLQGVFSSQYDSATKAAAGFAEIVTSKDTMLHDVVFEYHPSFEIDNYSFAAHISLVEVIRQSQAQDIPAERVDSFKAKAEQGTYSVSVSLPGEVIAHNADRIEGNVCTWDLSYGEETFIEIQTALSNTENLTYRSSLQERLSSTNMLILICAGIGILALLIVLVSVFVHRARRKRAAVVRARPFH